MKPGMEELLKRLESGVLELQKGDADDLAALMLESAEALRSLLGQRVELAGHSFHLAVRKDAMMLGMALDARLMLPLTIEQRVLGFKPRVLCASTGIAEQTLKDAARPQQLFGNALIQVGRYLRDE